MQYKQRYASSNFVENVRQIVVVYSDYGGIYQNEYIEDILLAFRRYQVRPSKR